jgi:cell division protein FtsB
MAAQQKLKTEAPVAEVVAPIVEPQGFLRRAWRPAGTVLAVALAGLMLLHVVNGAHGLSFWHQKNIEDSQLRSEISDLEQENARLQVRIDRLKNDPQTIGREARQALHYVGPNEVIVTLPPDRKPDPQPAAPNK